MDNITPELLRSAVGSNRNEQNGLDKWFWIKQNMFRGLFKIYTLVDYTNTKKREVNIALLPNSIFS